MKKKNAYDGIKRCVIENWYAMDYLLFGDKNPSTVLEKEELTRYKKLKGVFALNLFEIYKMVGVESKYVYENVNDLKHFSQKLAESALLESKTYINNKSSDIIQEAKTFKIKGHSLSESQKISYITKRKFLGNAIDNMVIKEAFEKFGYKLNRKDLKTNILLAAHEKTKKEIVELVI